MARSKAAAARFHPPPTPLTSFVGRAEEQDAIASTFRGGARLVSLVGPGGIGKTRLALEAVRQLAREGQRIGFCDLEGARSLEALATLLADCIGAPRAVTSTPAELAASVGIELARRGPCLIVLDDFERLVAHASAVAEWLAAAPRATLLVTSRERLNVEGEHVIEVGSLAMEGRDAPLARMRTCDAIRLFEERARAASASFRLRDEDLRTTCEIALMLEGIPLAIELCAARAHVLGPAQLLERLRTAGVLAASAPRAGKGAARKHALRSAIAWSWDSCEPAVRETLARLSVFRGGWELEAARSILELPRDERGLAEALGRVQTLHDRSLVRTYDPHGASGERRFAMYEPVREFAAERLAESGDQESALAAHTRTFVGAGTTWATNADGPEGRRARERLALEAANLNDVVLRSLAPPPDPARALDGLLALLALEPLVSERGPLDPYARALDEALQAASSGPLRSTAIAQGFLARGRLEITRGRLSDSVTLLTRAVDAALTTGDVGVAAMASSKRAAAEAFLDVPGMRERFAETAKLVAAANDPRIEGIYLSDFASALARAGDEHEALDLRERAVHRFTLAGDAHRRAVTLGYLGSHCLFVGRYADAERHADQAAVELGVFGDARARGQVLCFAARARHRLGRRDEALILYREALEVLRAVGERWFEGIALGWMADLASEDRDWEDAVSAYERAVSCCELASERPYAALFRAACQVARAFRDGTPVEDGAAVGEGADGERAGWASLPNPMRVAIRLHGIRGMLAGRTPSAEAQARASAALEIASAEAQAMVPPVLGSSEDARFAELLLRREIQPRARAAPEALRVGQGARWFERGSVRVDLARHRALRLVLLRLVAERIERPGLAVSRDELFRAGWPGAQIRAESAANRLAVLLTRMKDLGLRDLMRTQDDGVLLDAGVAVTMAVVTPS